MSGVLVIMELGAEWPAWTRTGVEVASRGGRRVLSQEEGESPDMFAERVADHLGSLFVKRVELERAVLACNERTDDRAMHARGKLGSALAGALSSRRGWQLLFTASGRTGRVRHALSDLATSLAASFSGAAASSVGVRFGDEMPLVQQANVA